MDKNISWRDGYREGFKDGAKSVKPITVAKQGQQGSEVRDSALARMQQGAKNIMEYLGR